MYQRNITNRLLETLADTPVVLLNGPRQSGKSTLVKRLREKGYVAHYLTFDDLAVLSAARADPVGFVENLGDRVILDEIQRVPELFLPIKAAVDRHRTPGRFLLTGSANIFSVPRIADSLAGRMEIVPLWPLSQGELEGRQERFLDTILSPDFSLSMVASSDATLVSRAALVTRMLRGGFPEAVQRTSDIRRHDFFNAYITMLLQRDVQDLAGISNVTQLERLLVALASRVGSLLNTADISRTIEIPATTLKRYLNLLDAMFLVQAVPAWAVNLDIRVVKSPRIYFSDTGVLTHQMRISAEALEHNPAAFGSILENFVVTELHKQLGWNRSARSLSYYRTQDGREVDVIVEGNDGSVVGIEIKAASTVTGKDFRGLQHLMEKAGPRVQRGIVLYTGQEAVAFGTNLFAVPIGVMGV